MKKQVYYLVWENDPQWWGAILKGERGYGKDDSITFTEETTITCAIGKFLLDLMKRDTHLVQIKDSKHFGVRKDYGCSISEDEYNRIKRCIEIYPLVEEFEDLAGLFISKTVKK